MRVRRGTRRCHRYRRRLAFGQQITEKRTDGNGRALTGNTAGDVKNAFVERFDLTEGLVALDRKENLSQSDAVAVIDEPLHEGALFHRPAETGHRDFDSHDGCPRYSPARWRTASAICSADGTTALSSGGL